MVSQAAALVAAALVVSSTALEIKQESKAQQERFMATAAKEAEKQCLANNVKQAMKVIALSVRPGGMGMANEDFRRVLDACFAKQDILGQGAACKLGSQKQCDWVSGCVIDNKCESPPMAEVLAQLEDRSQVVAESGATSDYNPPGGSQTIKGDGPKVHKWEGVFPNMKPPHLTVSKKEADPQFEAGPAVWTSNPLTNLAITLSARVAKGDDIDPP